MTTSTDLCYTPATKLGRLIRAKQISRVEITRVEITRAGTKYTSSWRLCEEGT